MNAAVNAPDAPMVRVLDVNKWYGQTQVLFDVNIEAAEG